MTKHFRNSFQGKQRGQSLVELGLTIVMLLWLLAGAVNFGMAYMTFVTIRDAAQEGAVYGALHPTELGAIQERVRDSVRYGAGNTTNAPVVPNEIGVDISTPDGICPGNFIKITTLYEYQLTIPFVDMMIDNPIPLHASASAEILRRVDMSCPAYEAP
jgi:TadE-like protein